MTEPGDRADPERRGIGQRRPTSTGSCSRSAWVCMSRADRVRPPSARSAVRGAPRSEAAAAASSTTWAAMPSHRARTRWPGPVSRPRPVSEPRTSPRHQGAASPGEGGDEGDAAAVRYGSADGVELRGTADHAQVGEPPHGRGDRVHLPVEAVGDAPAEPPGHAAHQAGRGAPGLGAGLCEEEGARAVGALGGGGVVGALGEQRRLLVHEKPGERERGAERGRGADRGVAVHDPGDSPPSPYRSVRSPTR
ncbi:hypothetical protein STANM309S_03777 [Streptomyces tanashiensis]